jgi:hypothetical protein
LRSLGFSITGEEHPFSIPAPGATAQPLPGAANRDGMQKTRAQVFSLFSLLALANLYLARRTLASA